MSEAFEPQDRDGGAALQAAPPLARALAWVIDAMLVFALVLGLRLAALQGLVRPLGGWHPGASEAWIDVPAALLGFLALAGREIPTGQSFAQWLLCLRPLRADGGRPTRAQRWRRALAIVVPLGTRRHDRSRVAVVSDAPSRRGLVARGALALGAAAWSLVWGFETMRPSIGRSDAERIVRATLLQDPMLRQQLGDPLEFEIRAIAPRRRRMLESGIAEFELAVRGTSLRQDMVVRAVHVDGRWAIDEIIDIRVAALDTAPGDTVAAR